MKRNEQKAARLHFGTLVRKTRESLGHRTARSFFSSQGGRPFFGCSYRSYLNLESGAAVPSPSLVNRLAAALRVALNEENARGFALAYLRMVLGFEDFLDFAVATLSDEPQDEARRATAGSGDGLSGGPLALSPRQAALLCESATCYWCLALLAKGPQDLTAGDLARRLGLGEPEIARALRRLEQVKLVSRRNGRYLCPRAASGFIFPEDRAGQGPAPLRDHWEALASRRNGATLFQHPFLMLASQGELRSYFPYLTQTVHAAELYGTAADCPDAGFFLVEAAVRKLFKF